MSGVKPDKFFSRGAQFCIVFRREGGIGLIILSAGNEINRARNFRERFEQILGGCFVEYPQPRLRPLLDIRFRLSGSATRALLQPFLVIAILRSVFTAGW